MSHGPHASAEGEAVSLGLLDLVGESLRLLKPVWPLAVLAGLLGIAGGATVAALLAEINAALNAKGGTTQAILLGLAGLVAATIAMSLGSEICNTVVGQRVVAGLRRHLCRSIVAAPLERIERITPQRLMAVLTADLDALSGITLSLAPLIVAAATTLACFGYLAWLSPALFAVVAVATVIGGIANARARRSGIKRIDAVWDAHEDMLKSYRTVVDGRKEMRMNRARRDELLTHRLGSAIDRIAGLQIRMRRQFGIADAIAQGLLWGTVVMVLAADGWVSKANAGAFILALLFMRGPMEQLLGALPMLSRGEVALRRITALSKSLGADGRADHAGSEQPAAPAFDKIEIAGGSHTYPARDGQDAVFVGPFDLTVNRGEILFITGENGAGKTTLLHMLTGLYESQQGSLRLDGRAVETADLDAYRELFSTVFYDFHLFDDLILPDDLEADEVARVLELLKLSEKVTVSDDGHLSTTDLSAGQRRRLALLQVYLDRRPIIVLDEWAAEQDPVFRRFFYTVILADLKRRGATVVAVSHDDRYFSAADRCLVLGEDGNFAAASSLPDAAPKHDQDAT